MEVGYTGDFPRTTYDGAPLNLVGRRRAGLPRGDCVSNSIKDFKKNVIYNIVVNMPNRKKMIDIGCGNGRHSFILSSYFDEVLAIDVHAEWGVIHNKPWFFDEIPPENTKKITFVCRDFLFPGENDELYKDKFDLIFFWGSFYMMQDWEAALKKCYQILSESGIIIIGDALGKRNDGSTPSDIEGRFGDHHWDGCISSANYNLGDLIERANLEEVAEYIFDYRVTVLRKKDESYSSSI